MSRNLLLNYTTRKINCYSASLNNSKTRPRLRPDGSKNINLFWTAFTFINIKAAGKYPAAFIKMYLIFLRENFLHFIKKAFFTFTRLWLKIGAAI
jgi:hypothetical protein